MSPDPKNKDDMRLSPDEARLVIKAIEEVEKEEAATEEKQRQSSKTTPST